MEKTIDDIRASAISDIKQSKAEHDLANVKSKYLGKTGILTKELINLKNIPVDDRKKYGPILNDLKREIDLLVSNKIYELNTNVNINFDETIDVYEKLGSLHPITIMSKRVTDILKRSGFTVVLGPEMESEYYNFEALNVEKDHPARDMQDTYWLSNGMLLRTHTSTNQVRAMETYGSPIKVCAPGRCFRNEDLDASHENTFFQLEGMVIDKNISISNLIYVIKGFLREIFEKDLDVRLRPGYFPFTEPSFELDSTCLICDGKGCPTCSHTGWIELCPCGMIHPKVLEMSGIDSNEYNGFAFGLGLARLVMLKYKLDDIRVLNSGDLRHLKEFK